MVTNTRETYKITEIVDNVKAYIDEIIQMPIAVDKLGEEEAKKQTAKKVMLQSAVVDCVFSRQEKEFVKQFIFAYLENNYSIDTQNINQIIAFNESKRLTAADKFDIIIYMYKQKFRYDAMNEIIRKYELDGLKCIDEMEYFAITKEEIEKIFELENYNLTFQDKFNILVQRVYSRYKGYSVIDDLLDMKLDGISCGVNGLTEMTMTDLTDELNEYMTGTSTPKAYDSVWIMYRGKSIHLRFLSLGSFEELKRICNTVYMYDNPGQFSRKDGYKVNKLKSGSRVVVFRPEFSETWSFFIRNFESSSNTLSGLFSEKEKAKNITVPLHIYDSCTKTAKDELDSDFFKIDNNDSRNTGLLIGMIIYIAKACCNTFITGEQGCGKTTTFKAIVKHIYHIYNLRVLELAFELELRKIYPFRNILTVRETEQITGQDALNIFKKTDGRVNIIGEIVTDPVFALAMQSTRVGSACVFATHHAVTFPYLVDAARNAILSKDGFMSDVKLAEEYVVRGIDFNIHQDLNMFEGTRWISRVTQCVVKDEYDGAKNEKPYNYNNVIEYDVNKKAYFVANKLSKVLENKIRKNLTAYDRIKFDEFINTFELKG